MKQFRTRAVLFALIALPVLALLLSGCEYYMFGHIRQDIWFNENGGGFVKLSLEFEVPDSEVYEQSLEIARINWMTDYLSRIVGRDGIRLLRYEVKEKTDLLGDTILHELEFAFADLAVLDLILSSSDREGIYWSDTNYDDIVIEPAALYMFSTSILEKASWIDNLNFELNFHTPGELIDPLQQEGFSTPDSQTLSWQGSLYEGVVETFPEQIILKFF